jgi:hypothetical protein
MEKLNRFEFIRKLGVLGLGAGGAIILTACGGGSSEAEEADGASSEKPQSLYSKEKKEVVKADCSSYNAELSQSDIELRNTLKYEEESSEPGKNCVNCMFFVPDKFEGDCGGCQLFTKGAVNPQGMCQSWSAKA